MSLLNSLERKFGWIAIEALPIYIVSAQAVLYVWGMINPESQSWLVLDPVAVRYVHEYWRLLTFLFITPSQNPIFAFFFLYLLYIYGMALEQQWGSFRFSLFYFLGALGTIVSAFFFGGNKWRFLFKHQFVFGFCRHES